MKIISKEYKELEALVIKFFDESPVTFDAIATKIDIPRGALVKGISDKHLFKLIAEISKWGFKIGKYEFGSIANDKGLLKLFAYDATELVKIQDIDYKEFNSLEDIITFNTKHYESEI